MASQVKYDMSTKNILDTYGIHEDILNNMIFNSELNSAKFITWDGKKFYNINQLPADHKTRKNIIITRKVTHGYNSTNPNISSEFKTYVFLT